jgi:4-amino-4-deoxy-L-arabinose transferase-like glycosyltransferase
MNMPGVYLIHLAVLALGGAGDVAWRTFELGWLGATAGLMYRYGRPLGDRLSAATPALFFAIHHLAGGPSLAGQRDFLICLFLLAGACGVARSCESRGRLAPLLGAGLILGFALMVKPLAALYVVLCAVAAALAAYRAGRSWLAAVAAVLLGALVMPILLLGWLAWVGGLRAFVWTLVEWTVPFYSQAGGAGYLRVLVSLNWGLLAAAALLGAARRGAPYDVRRWLDVGGAVYGFLHFALQFKGYDYHLYPLALFLCLSFGLALAPDAGKASARPMRLRAYARGLAVVLVASAVIVTGVRGLDRLSQPFEVGRVQRVAGAVGELRKLVAPGETVQVMGPSGAHVLLRLGLRQPTRFFTDFQFFLGAADPRIQGLRTEFMAGLEAGPPAAIVMFPERHAAGPYGRLDDFPALAALLEHRYAIVVDNASYRIYARRPGA